MEKRILVVIDMQNDFVSGTLGSDAAKLIVTKVLKKVENFEGEVVFTRDTHGVDYLDTQEGKKLPVMHCLKKTDGWQFVQSLIGLSKNRKIFDKDTFASKALAEYLWTRCNEEKIEGIDLIGLCTDICVISNALLLKAWIPEIPIVVDASCCAGVTVESHKNSLDAMKMCQIEIIND